MFEFATSRPFLLALLALLPPVQLAERLGRLLQFRHKELHVVQDVVQNLLHKQQLGLRVGLLRH